MSMNTARLRPLSSAPILTSLDQEGQPGLMRPAATTDEPWPRLFMVFSDDALEQQAAHAAQPGEARIRATCEVLSTRLKSPGNGRFGMSADASGMLTGDDGSPVEAVMSFSGIAKRRKAECGPLPNGAQAANCCMTAVRTSQERYRTLFESLDQGVCIIEMVFDPAGVPVDFWFLEMNAVFEQQTGLQDAVGTTLSGLDPEQESFCLETYGRVALTGEPVRFEKLDESTHRWFDIFATRIDEPGSSKVALWYSDITARRTSEDDLRRLAADLAEADRRRTEFLATLAHELKSPLAPIRSGLAMLRMEGSDPAAVEKALAMMDRQVSQMARLIDELQDMARIASGKVELRKERVALNSVIFSAIETSLPLIEAMQHDLVIDIPDNTLMLDADPARLVQVLVNLLNNAAKYTPLGGRIDLSARQDGCEAVICVADNGVGIPAASLATLFQMYSQVGQNMSLAQGGLGIGLSLVRQFVELHGGTAIGTSSGTGQGSTFTVRLPLANASADTPPAVAVPHPAQANQAIPRPLRVLVVDDHVDAAQALSATLALKGHRTQTTHNGQQALESAREFRPDIVFLDISMPGMDGYETAQTLRQIAGLEQTVLVALTGWGDRKARARSHNAGFDHHLTKPTESATVDALLSTIADSLGPHTRAAVKRH